MLRFEDVKAAPERLAKARAVLAEVEGRKEVRPAPVRKEIELDIPPTAKERVERLEKAKAAPEPVAPKKAGFDRNAYHKAYMRDYMRRRRVK